MNDKERILIAGALADAIVAGARAGGEDCWIPSCPQWKMSQLVAHVASEYSAWYYANLTTPPDHPDPVQAALQAAPPCPDDFAAAVDYLETQAARFCSRAGEVDLDVEVWAYGAPPRARFWVRMAIGEVAAHAWDACRAVGIPSPLNTEIAVEAIDQFATFLVHRGSGRYLCPWSPPAESLGLVADDAGRSWLLHTENGHVVCSRDQAAAARVRVSGPAESLYLGWFGRQAAPLLRIEGDPAVLGAWRSDP